MSLSTPDDSEKNNSLSIPEILADFFLRKFDMPSYSDDSDHKHKGKKKKSKHKKRKHKKSKHRHGNDSSDSLSRSPDSNSKVIVDDVSSSEEMGIQRLKKIKNRKLQSVNKNALQTVSLPSDPEIKDKSDLSNSSVNKNLEFYGPYLDLMLSGTEPSSSSSKTDAVANVPSANDKYINFEHDLSKEEKSLKTNTDFSKQNNGVLSSNLSIPLSVYNNENVHSVPVCDSSKVVNDTGKSDTLLRNSFSEIQADIVCEKLNLEQKCKNDKSNDEIKQNNSSPVTKRKSMDKGRKHSRSRSRSKSKHKRRTSRSSSRGSHHSRRKRKKYSRSHSRERLKSSEYKKRSHSRSRSKSRYTKRKKNSRSPHERCRNRSRSRSRKHETSRWRSSSRKRRRSYSKDRERSSSVSRYKARSSRRSTSDSRSRSKSKTKQTSHSKLKSRSRSKSKERRSSRSTTKIDQAKILETARKNVLKMMQDGTLPEGLPVENLKKEQLVSIQAGGKSVQELTDFCQRLSQKENEPDGSDNDDKDKPDEQTGFIHHPFKMKEPGMIKLNIKNAVQLPIKTHAQKVAETARLSSQFPVSSGNQHRQKELEWIPVVPATSKNEAKPAKINVSSTLDSNKSLEVKPKIPVLSAPPPVPSPLVPVSYLSEASKVEAPPVVSPLLPPLPPPPLPPPLQPPMQPPTLYQMPTQPVMPSYIMPNQEFHMNSYASKSTVMPLSTSVFKVPKKLDIPTIVAKRFQALTKLQQDPKDPDALKIIHDAQESIQEWVESQQVPGLFTGSTDAKMLTAAELCGPKYHKFRKDILSHAPPVTEGKGMSLLKKMGWNPGEGLGKNKEGSLEPLMLDIKTDKKGLVSEGENSKKGASSFSKEFQGKHPVSALMELCSKRRWKPPLYTCVLDHGPPHRKLFCFKVEVNGVEYQPANPCSNKKVAKADAAVLCLQSLNILSKT